MDQMQNRGFTPSVIEDAVNNGISNPNKVSGRIQFYDSANNITVIIENAKVVTTMYENNKLDLYELISDLGGLLNTLESIPNCWRDDFQAEINDLEMIHDSIEDSSISRWKGDYKNDIYKAISNLKKMAFSILESI